MIGWWSAIDATEWLVIGFLVTFALWLALSVLVIVNRIWYDRHAPRRRERRSLPHLLRDAASSRRGKWRRISALAALARAQPPELHDLLGRAACDRDDDVAGSAVTLLHRLGDRRAAEILVDALRTASYSASRIATQLDLFPQPIDDLLLPLLDDPSARARYWGASLLARYRGVPDLAPALLPLVTDIDPQVRKAAITTLTELDAAIGARAGRERLGDSIGFVRAAAIRAVGNGAAAADATSRHDAARQIAPSLADASWDARLAAKESLVRLGPDVWPDVAPYLDSSDAFARNSAAEVLQNLGLVDRVIDEVGRGTDPGTELLGVLERAFRAGGPRLIDAAAARTDQRRFPTVDTLLTTLRFVGVNPPA
jgi:HEAT repeat protein